CHGRLRLRHCRPGPKAAEQKQPTRRPVLEVLLVRIEQGLHGDWQPQIERSFDDLAAKSLARDANDGHRHVVDENLLTDDAAIAGETPCPILVADDDDGGTARDAVLDFTEGAA